MALLFGYMQRAYGQVFEQMASQATRFGLAHLRIKITYSSSSEEKSSTVLLELPVSVIQWAHLTGLQPSRDTMEVECVLHSVTHVSYLRIGTVDRQDTYIANPPGHCTLLSCR